MGSLVPGTAVNFVNVHSVSLSFRLHLSVNGRIAIQPYTSHLNYHLAIYTQKYKKKFILKCLAKLLFGCFQ